jgi:hypothetical protein
MTTPQRSTRALLALGVLALFACSEQATNPNPALLIGEPQSGKGGGGKPGGGGGGGGPAPAAEIAFHDNGSLWVMNADGSGRTQLYSNSCSTSISSWAPFGDGTAATPFRILNWGSCAPEAFIVADVDTAGGSIHVRNVQPIHIAGDWWDTQEASAPHYGQPAWKPETGDEIVLAASWQANPETNEWVSALYVFPTSELPDPAPQLLYQPPPGCPDASYPAWSPDGNSIAFVENCEVGGQAIRAIDRATGTVTTLLSFGVLDGIGTIDWSSSGASIAFSAGQSAYTLRLMPGAAPQLIGSGFGVSWSPDPADSRLAFNSSGKNKIKILNFGTGQVTTLGSGRQPDWRPF